MITMMLIYAQAFIGAPYLYGGNGPYFDCSSYIQEVLASAGLDPKGDQTAQTLYNILRDRHWPSQLAKGSLLFYGDARNRISHVAMVLDDDCEFMIEAAGGDSTTLTLEDANKRGAMVRVRPIRTNFIAILKPIF